MNSAILDILKDASLREVGALEAHLVQHISAGTPWLIEE